MTIKIVRRRKVSWMGRFGGGWNWKLGFQAGGRTLILSLLVFEIRFDFINHEAYGTKP